MRAFAKNSSRATSDRVHFFDSIGPTGKIILTITASTASKGAALQAACAHLGLQPREVVAFGDAENDIEMFRVAGASVAMGQASDEVKANGHGGDVAQRRSGRRARHRAIVSERPRLKERQPRQFDAAAAAPCCCTRSCTEFSAS